MRTELFLYFLFAIIISAEKCEDKVEYHLGSKSPYRFVANKNYSKDEDIQGCVKKIWMLVRHGTRNPSIDEIRKMSGHLPLLQDIVLERNSNNIKSNLIKSDLELFEKWKPKVQEKNQKKLTIEGEYEMLELAERMQARFPNVLQPIYSNTSYKFKFTKTQRTKKSAQSFTVGLFDKKTAKDVFYLETSKFDLILRFYKLCSKWKTSVKHNDTTYEERKKFQDSLIMQNALKRISDKLNLDTTLSFDDAFLMYKTCAFETSWSSKKKSPWCVPFDLDTIKIMEYAEELKYYWVDSYANEITYKPACPTFNDMLNFMLDKNPYPKATLYFTHSGTMLKMFSHLGLYKDDKPLKGDNYSENDNRKWRVSKIGTFGTNLAFVLYQCNNENKLLVLHNESPVRLPCCPDNDLCDLEIIQQYYTDSINACFFDDICENRKN